MKTHEFIKVLDELAPPEYAESWDNVGLLEGSLDREVHKVYIALDADGTAVQNAVREGCDMIVTHHPLLFSAIKSIREDDFIGRRLLMMIENRINYFAMHTNFDVAVMADLAADYLKLKHVAPLAMLRETAGGPKGIGCVGEFENHITLSDLAACVKNVFDLPQVRYYGDPHGVIEKIAMCPGSGKGMDQDALASGAQVLITGDVDHHYGLDCVEKGLWVIDAGHHGLEHIFVAFMKQWLSERFPELEIITDRNDSPFRVV
ncbi:MAG: Nif3-like dinuclear metal center hexameric protein [Coprococcus sp.]